MMGKKTQRSVFVGTACLPDKKAKEYCSPTGSKTTFFRQIKAEMTQKKTRSGPFDKKTTGLWQYIYIYNYR